MLDPREVEAALELMALTDGRPLQVSEIPSRAEIDAAAHMIAAAARAVAEGVPIQWCEVHGDWSATHLGDGTMCRWAVKVNSDKTCSIVSRLLVDYPKEGTE